MAHRLSFSGICFYYLSSGGVSLKTQKLALVCRYTEDNRSIAQIIQNSFEIFLKRELKNVEKYLCSTV